MPKDDKKQLINNIIEEKPINKKEDIIVSNKQVKKMEDIIISTKSTNKIEDVIEKVPKNFFKKLDELIGPEPQNKAEELSWVKMGIEHSIEKEDIQSCMEHVGKWHFEALEFLNEMTKTGMFTKGSAEYQKIKDEFFLTPSESLEVGKMFNQKIDELKLPEQLKKDFSDILAMDTKVPDLNVDKLNKLKAQTGSLEIGAGIKPRSPKLH